MIQAVNTRWLWIGLVLLGAVILVSLITWLSLRYVPLPEEVVAPPPLLTSPTSTGDGLGATIYQEVNPGAKLPETNPFRQTPNPFEEVYRNPFGE